MTAAHDLVRQWREDAEVLRRYEDERTALILLAQAGQLEEALQLDADTLLSIKEAARLSGYSSDHLRRMIREGTIPNAGRKNAPRIRLRDLPRKPVSLPPQEPGLQLAGASIEQIVRTVVNSENGGNDG
jgi:hypothetical protein